MEERIAGRLLCTVLGAEGIWPKGVDGKSVSFCSVILDKSQPAEKTQEIGGTLSPQWNELLSFPVARPFEVLEATVYHSYGEEAPGLDGFQGRVTVPLESLGDQKPHDFNLTLLPREPKDEVSGKLLLRLQYKYMKEWASVYQSLEALKAKEWERALTLLDEAIGIIGNQPRLYQARSEALVNLQRLQEAMRDAQKMLEINPNIAIAHYQIGRVYEAAGEKAPALEAYKQGLGYDGKDTLLQEAVSRLDRSKPNFDPKIAEVAYLVQQHFNAGSFDDAATQLTKMIASDPKSCSFHVARAECALGQKQADLAQEHAMKAVSLDPKWPKEGAEMQGWMKKEGALNKMKKRRWFVLKGHFLFYYKTNEDQAPNGVIPLHTTCSVLRAAAAGKKIMIKLPNRTFFLVSMSAKSGEEWLAAMQAAVKSPLALPMIQGSTNNLAGGSGRAARASRRKQYGLSGQLIRGKIASMRYHDVSVEGGLTDIIREGYLYKEGNVIRGGWKKRYFVLKKMHLYYFEEKPKEGTTALGEVPLDGTEWEKGQDDDFAHHVFNLVTSVRTYVLYAITKEDMLEWKAAIEEASGIVQEPTTETTSLMLLTPSRSESVTHNDDIVAPEPQPEPQPEPVVEQEPEPAVEVKNDMPPMLLQQNMGQRMGVDAMSASESRYFKKFGLQPPELNKHESLHRIEKPQERLQSALGEAPSLGDSRSLSMRSLPKMDSNTPVEPAHKSVQNYSDSLRKPREKNPLDAMGGVPSYTAMGNSPEAVEETPLLGAHSLQSSDLTPAQRQARQREMERRRRAQQQRDESCCIIL